MLLLFGAGNNDCMDRACRLKTDEHGGAHAGTLCAVRTVAMRGEEIRRVVCKPLDGILGIVLCEKKNADRASFACDCVSAF